VKNLLLVAGALIVTQLTGCASMVNGTHQRISVVTSPEAGAQCNLKNTRGAWSIAKTPGSTEVHRSKDDLVVICAKPGYKEATSKVKSTVSKVVYGNILAGGLIGGGVDSQNCSMYSYPDRVKVPLVPQK
jgi:hypothetical protein